MLNVKVNNGAAVAVDAQMTADLDIVTLPANETFHLVRNHQTYTIEILEKNLTEKSLTLRINGRIYTAQAEDELDQLLKKLGIGGGGANKVNHVKAPMPGLMLQVLVAEGQAVKKGDSLLILEAMKMENIIKSSGDGVVKSIKVKQGTPVDKNQILIEMA